MKISHFHDLLCISSKALYQVQTFNKLIHCHFKHIMMGDSETEADLSGDESCSGEESPVLYIGTNISKMINTTTISQNNNVEIENYQESCTMDALADLDSMLERPIVPPMKSFASTTCTLSRTAGITKTIRKDKKDNKTTRSIPEVLAKLPSGILKISTLVERLESQDLRVLLNACGVRALSNLTKVACAERLLPLINQGALDTFGGIAKSESCPAHTPMEVVPVPLLTESGTARATVPETKAVVLLLDENPLAWKPVKEGSTCEHGLGAPASKLGNGYSEPGGAFFAPTRTEEWNVCDEATHYELRAIDPGAVFRTMLNKLHHTPGAFGALPLAGQGGHIKTEEKSTDVETEHKENLDNPSVYQIIEILQQKLRGKASLPLHTSSAHQPFLSSHGGATIKNSLNEIPEQWDSVKLVRFRSTRLGLLLAKSVDVDGFERAVVQGKLPGQLDAAIDRLLYVGDVVVSIQGVPVLKHESFTEVLNRIKTAARPLVLGFIPGGSCSTHSQL